MILNSYYYMLILAHDVDAGLNEGFQSWGRLYKTLNHFFNHCFVVK